VAHSSGAPARASPRLSSRRLHCRGLDVLQWLHRPGVEGLHAVRNRLGNTPPACHLQWRRPQRARMEHPLEQLGRRSGDWSWAQLALPTSGRLLRDARRNRAARVRNRPVLANRSARIPTPASTRPRSSRRFSRTVVRLGWTAQPLPLVVRIALGGRYLRTLAQAIDAPLGGSRPPAADVSAASRHACRYAHIDRAAV
jgi:hypothetical protein